MLLLVLLPAAILSQITNWFAETFPILSEIMQRIAEFFLSF